MTTPPKKERLNTYFASDIHIGSPSCSNNREREVIFTEWLDSIKESAKALYILGDMFDFWYEYKHAIPKGGIRMLGKLAELSDMGVEIHFFKGNHDLWTKGYFEEELSMIIHDDNEELEIDGKRFILGHGDGLNSKDWKYAIIRKLLRNRFLDWCFNKLHPNWAIGFANAWSAHSRKSHSIEEVQFMGEEREDQVQYAKRAVEENPNIDFIIFGHRHIAKRIPIKVHKEREAVHQPILIMLGDWITLNSFALFDGSDLSLHSFKKK